MDEVVIRGPHGNEMTIQVLFQRNLFIPGESKKAVATGYDLRRESHLG